MTKTKQIEALEKVKKMVCPSCLDGCTKESCLFYKLFTIIDSQQREIEELKQKVFPCEDDSDSKTQQAWAWREVWNKLKEVGVHSFLPAPITSTTAERARQFIADLQSRLEAAEDKTKHTIEVCQKYVTQGNMSMLAAAEITGVPYKKIRDEWPIDKQKGGE
jgi:hypothetical protein